MYIFENFFKETTAKNVKVYTNFNYLALTGLDYEKHSFSIGAYYPVYAFVAGSHLREVLASRLSVLSRYLYTDTDFRVKFVYSPTNYSSSNPTDEDIELSTLGEQPESLKEGESPVKPMDSFNNFNFNSFFVLGVLEFLFIFSL